MGCPEVGWPGRRPCPCPQRGDTLALQLPALGSSHTGLSPHKLLWPLLVPSAGLTRGLMWEEVLGEVCTAQQLSPLVQGRVEPERIPGVPAQVCSDREFHRAAVPTAWGAVELDTLPTGQHIVGPRGGRQTPCPETMLGEIASLWARPVGS